MSEARRIGRASLWLFGATVLLNLSMVLYHRAMSSGLGAAYAQLAALNGVINVLNVFALGALATLTKVFAQDRHRQGDGAAADRLRRVSFKALQGVALSSVLLLLLTPWGADYLRLPSRSLFAMTALLFGGFIAMVVVRAALQGRQAYGWLAGSYVAEGAGRLSISWALVSSGWGVMGALWGAAAAQLSVVLACLPGLPRHDGKTRAHKAEAGWRGESASDTAVMVLFSLLCYLDIFVVKHHWDEPRVAMYSRAALIGKSFLYLGAALNLVLLPEVAAARAKGAATLPLLGRFLGLAALLLGLALGVLWAWTPLAIHLLCGSDPAFQALVPLARGFSLAVLPLALFQLVMTYHVAVGNRSLPWLMGMVILLYGLTLNLLPLDESAVVAALGTGAAVLLAAAIGMAYWQRPARA